ncbi:hypothetical protein ABE189_10330 [Bacillus subtilis]|uniref:hypothetical protein n=1 Tax=Bacillus TaxID=1386 RepID=UPI000BA2273E|nr:MULTISPECIES: hypothetical protein [Bacillus]ASU97262.1 hypothetical protein CJZ70_02225 [Bacillus subtilis]PTN36472.1 hypothetical protein DAD79_01145 [Bacillus sp. Rc4]QAW18347.1 hypothetical protein ETA19_18570 [Bacillus subtilis]QAW22420.1 hypothetical protein ETA18_18570 [Bacillus subtilis]CAF1823798.1 hypothetical protein NRS6141_02108 [Bacillus subtilis]
MKAKFKKLIGAIAIVSLVFTGFAVSNVSAKGNTKDTNFSFHFTNSTSGKYEYTGSREKRDNTSAYMSLKSISMTGAVHYYAELVTSSGKSFSKPYRYAFGNNFRLYPKTQYLKNYAHEDYKKTIKVKIEATGYGTVNSWGAAGVWSPDSV